jgi:hypothetical protein
VAADKEYDGWVSQIESLGPALTTAWREIYSIIESDTGGHGTKLVAVRTSVTEPAVISAMLGV